MNFTKHIFSQNDDILSKQIINEQIKNDWSGLSCDASKICSELNISGLFDSKVTKKQFKLNVKKVCSQTNENDLKRQISSYKKMSAIRDEMAKGNGYFFCQNLQSVRTIFRFRVEMFEAKLNFKNKAEYKNENFMCDSCMSQTDENTHVLFCPSYSTLRENKNMNDDSHLSEYLQKVLQIRMKLRLDR